MLSPTINISNVETFLEELHQLQLSDTLKTRHSGAVVAKLSMVVKASMGLLSFWQCMVKTLLLKDSLFPKV